MCELVQYIGNDMRKSAKEVSSMMNDVVDIHWVRRKRERNRGEMTHEF
jgi:hypothetical protein